MYTSYYIVTVSMALCFVLGFCTFLLSYKASEYFWDKLESNPLLDVSVLRSMKQSMFKQSLLLYGVHIASCMCILLFFLCHLSNEFASWFCEYGMTLSVILYFAAKSFLYGYLLERATLTQSEDKPIVSSCIMKKVFPMYLFLYFIIWFIMCLISFRGHLSQIDLNECIFDEFKPSAFIVSSIIDIVHCIGLTLLFLAPNFRAIYYAYSDVFKTRAQIQIFVNQSNVYLLCIITSCISSVIFMLFMSHQVFIGIKPQYIWFVGSCDMLINSVSAFFTLTSNRTYLSHYKSCTLCYHCDSITNYLMYRMENPPKQIESDNEEIEIECIEDEDIPGMQNDASIPMFNANNSLFTQPEISDYDLPLMRCDDSSQMGMLGLLFVPVQPQQYNMSFESV